MKILGSMLLLIGLSAVAFAQSEDTAPVPEINPASAVTAISLISGALLVARGRRKK
jgi:hypothetical protein